MKKVAFFIGVGILVVLAVTYFIQISIHGPGDPENVLTWTPLLGILILYNPFVLGLYVLIAIVLIVKRWKRKKLH